MKFEMAGSDRLVHDELKSGELVEVEIAPGVWVPAIVVHDMETRVGVKLVTPVWYVQQKTTKTVICAPWFFSLFFKDKEEVKEEVEYSYTESVHTGRWYVRRPLPRPQ